MAKLTPQTHPSCPKQSRFFGGDPRAVPRMALTVGVATVLESREIGECSDYLVFIALVPTLFTISTCHSTSVGHHGPKKVSSIAQVH